MGYIYKYNDIADSAYILEDGKVSFSLPGGDSFTIEGKNQIFGVEEVLIGWEQNKHSNRLMTVSETIVDTKYKIIKESNLKKFIEHYNIGFSITKSIALTLMEINKIIKNRINSLSERERKSQEYAKAYSIIVDKIKEEYDKKRFPVLKELYDKLINSLTYKFGLGFRGIVKKAMIKIENESLDSLLRTYNKDEIICNHGDEGQELYILNSGKLGIYFEDDDAPFATVDNPGEVIGEMSLLLGNKRTATIKAETPVSLSVIKEDDLKNVAESKPDFFYQLSLTISHRVKSACEHLNEIVSEYEDSHVPDSLIEDSHHDAFMHLDRLIFTKHRESDMPVIKDIYNLVRSMKNNI